MLDAQQSEPAMTSYKPRAKTIPTHELRTPLHAMQSAVELLLDGSAGKLSLEALEIVGLLARSQRQLSKALDLTVQLANLSVGGEAYRELVPLTGLSRRSQDLSPELCLYSVEICQAEFTRAMVLLEGTSMRASEREIRIDASQVLVSGTIGRAPDASGDGALAWIVANVLLERSDCRLETLGSEGYRITIPLAGSGADQRETRPSASRNTSSCGSSISTIALSDRPK